jgi:hypothetical protein
MIKFSIDRTELIALKTRASLEDLTCSKVALHYKEEGFQICFSKAFDAVLGNPEGNTFTVRDTIYIMIFQVYFVQIETMIQTWVVAYRYSQLEKLNLSVSINELTHYKLSKRVRSLPTFPAKKFFKN